MPQRNGYAEKIMLTAVVFYEIFYEIDFINANSNLGRRTMADIEARNQRGEVVAVAVGLLKWVKKDR